MSVYKLLEPHWKSLYSDTEPELLKDFVRELEQIRESINFQPHPQEWYKDAVVYSLYVELFAGDFQKLTSKLDYLSDLGVSCLWLLPILDSPMRDGGFDIRNYRMIRSELTGLPADAPEEKHLDVFRHFLDEAHKRDIRVIFDIAINHTSDQHPWFQEAKKSKESPYRDYYIWSKDTSLYKEARIIFEGLCTSNWEKSGDEYYFHRFFEFQPDLNYRNPRVLLEMTRNFIFWLRMGVDGFRADAIPYLWKEEGTTCENHPMLHHIIRFFRTVLEYLRPSTLLLAEACQKPKEVVRYFGDGDECNAGYHFPLMPQIYKAVAAESSQPVQNILSREVTPAIPENAQWFTFLRCHDELSLELVYVSEEDRKYIHDHYCKKPEWDFRQGQGISARLADLMDRDPDKISLAFSIMLTLPGTPVVYYGDEFGKTNDEEFYRKMIRHTGKDDTRFLVRGEVDWQQLETELKKPGSYTSVIYNKVRNMLHVRNRFHCFGRGEINWLKAQDTNGLPAGNILAFERKWQQERILVVHNLSPGEFWIHLPQAATRSFNDLLGNSIIQGKEAGYLMIKPWQYLWIDKTK